MSPRGWCTRSSGAANEADINQAAALLHGREEAVFADAGYTGADKRLEFEDCLSSSQGTRDKTTQQVWLTIRPHSGF
jgi:hypothetical protein